MERIPASPQPSPVTQDGLIILAQMESSYRVVKLLAKT